MSDFANRMKQYESLEINRNLIPLLPVYIRLDGRSFTNFTRFMAKPYDDRMVECMIQTTKHLVKETNACIGYTQSDEISLVIFRNSYYSQIFFNGKIFKITSILAGIASTCFLLNYIKIFGIEISPSDTIPVFDCRVINMPSKTETSNMILWRELDATRNAIISSARSILSHKEIQGKDCSELQELMFKRGINFNDYPNYFKRGTFIGKRKEVKEIEQEIWDKIPDSKKPLSRESERNIVVELDMPIFSKVINREDVIFCGANPILEELNQ